jgi:hypothetical protein
VKCSAGKLTGAGAELEVEVAVSGAMADPSALASFFLSPLRTKKISPNRQTITPTTKAIRSFLFGFSLACVTPWNIESGLETLAAEIPHAEQDCAPSSSSVPHCSHFTHLLRK